MTFGSSSNTPVSAIGTSASRPPTTSGLTRRSFFGTAGTLAGALAISQMVPRPLRAQLGRRNDAAPEITDPSIKTFVFRGVQAARDAGATFAEVRVSQTLQRSIDAKRFSDSHLIHAGVQAYVDGVWGFASSAVWNDDDLVQLAHAAVAQAREIARAQSSLVQSAVKGVKRGSFSDLPARPPGATSGHWVTPITDDPFAVNPYVLRDLLAGLTTQLPLEFSKQANETASVSLSALCIVQERAYGASDDTFVTQRLYKVGGGMTAGLTLTTPKGVKRAIRRVPLVTVSGMGWELFAPDALRDAAFATFERIREEFALQLNPVTVGRHPIILDAHGTGMLLSQTIGLSTELDRALGYGGGDGLGWLGQPATMVDTFSVGSSLLTVTANRSEPGGAATVQWDDEGVVPQPVTLVEQGMLKHYQHTRAVAHWLASAGNTTPSSPSSPTGVALAPTAGSAPAACCANLVMAGSPTGGTYTDLLKQVGDGVVFEDISVSLAPTCRTGLVIGRAYELMNGRKASRLANAGFLLDAQAFWRSLSALGGSASAMRHGESSRKGYPGRDLTWHSVTAVPAAFTSQPVIDIGAR